MHKNPLVVSRSSWRALPGLAAGLLSLSALAGRPLGTEDAGTNPQAQCQLEAWVDNTSGARSTHVGPACGLIDGLELGFELVNATPRDEQPQGRALALKWAPEWLEWQGTRFGLKLGTASERAPGETNWHQATVAALAIVSMPLGPSWTVHLNAGRQRDKLAGASSTTYGAALTWTPHERWLVFGELTGDNQSAATQTVGLRWWLLPETLGLDLTSSRTNATPDSRAWGIGLGWYGIRF